MHMCDCIHSIDAYVLHIHTPYICAYIYVALCVGMCVCIMALCLSLVSPLFYPPHLRQSINDSDSLLAESFLWTPQELLASLQTGHWGSNAQPGSRTSGTAFPGPRGWVPCRTIGQTWLQWWTSCLLQISNMTCTLNTLINALETCNSCLSVLFYILGLAKFQNIATNQ